MAGPRLAIHWGADVVPAEFARDAVVFLRAYTPCPEATFAVRSLERGRFPHAFRDVDAAVADFFTRVDDADDGITVWTSASGDGKDSPRERSLKVPLAIRWPGVLAPRVVSGVLTSLVDVLPTLLTLAGISHPAGLQGRDLSVAVRGRAGEIPDSVFAEGAMDEPGEWRAVIRGFDKLVWNLKEEASGLYNLADDPTEARDVKDDHDHRLTRDSLWALARQWMERSEDGRDAHGLRTRRVE